jgi:hypothetical protein
MMPDGFKKDSGMSKSLRKGGLDERLACARKEPWVAETGQGKRQASDMRWCAQRLPEGTDRKLCRGYMKHESLGMNDDSKDAINPPLLADSREGSGLRR